MENEAKYGITMPWWLCYGRKSYGKQIKAVKSVTVPHSDEALASVLEAFRHMVNHCLNKAIERGITGRNRLSQEECYSDISKSALHSWYALSAIETACAMARNYRKAKRKNANAQKPYAKRLFAKIECQALKLEGEYLRIPTKSREFVFVKLHKRALEFARAYRLGSATITLNAIYLAFTKAHEKTAEAIEPRGNDYIAIDINEDNLTTVDSQGNTKLYDLSALVQAGYGYFARIKRLLERYSSDRRVLKKVLSKFYNH